MRFKSSFQLRDICGDQVLIATGVEHINFSSLIGLNETAADVYQHFQEKDFEKDDLIQYIEEHYEGEAHEQIVADVDALLQQLNEIGIIE